MIVDCAYYQDGLGRGELRASGGGVGPARPGRLRVGLFDPDTEELARIREAFGLHELAIEDAQIVHRRPKIESYDKDVRLVVLRTARYNDQAEEVEFGEISIFIAPTFVIAVRQGEAELRKAWRRLSSGRTATRGAESVLWAILEERETHVSGAGNPSAVHSPDPVRPAASSGPDPPGARTAMGPPRSQRSRSSEPP